MIALILIYFIGKAFYDLAGKFQKSQWGFAILGVVSYYAGILIGGLILGVLIELGVTPYLQDLSDSVYTLIALPLGVLSCWGTYRFLKSQWTSASSTQQNEVLDADLTR
jgi:hypothetical protein